MWRQRGNQLARASQASAAEAKGCLKVQTSADTHPVLPFLSQRFFVRACTVKKIFRITDEFAHNYVIFVTILCPTLTKMDTLIIQNKLRILRNGFQNSRNPFPILVDFQKSGKDYIYSVINYRYSIIFSVPSFYKFSFHIKKSCNYPQEGSLV